MRENGRLMTCDRCGNQTFSKCIGEREMDGGFTRWSEFEEAEGWTKELDIGDLCPGCTEEFKKIVENFKTEKENFIGRIHR